MADSDRSELRQRRTALSESLPALSRKRDRTYRMNSDALALDRAGVRRQARHDMARLGEDHAEADAAIRGAQREIRDLDAKISSASRGGLRARVIRALRRS
jgi:hypothetical protein